MYDLLTGVENEIATAIAMNSENVLRAVIHDTVPVASGGLVPTVGSSSATAKIIGVWGQVRDAASPFTELTEGLNEDEIRTVNQSSVFISSYYGYIVRPPRIYATVANMLIDCCVFDLPARQAAINANGALLFPMAQNAYFDGLMSGLKNEDPLYANLSNEFTKPYESWLQSQRGV
jgi:hypothetical protein